jgi:hypothetical protein
MQSCSELVVICTNSFDFVGCGGGFQRTMWVGFSKVKYLETRITTFFGFKIKRPQCDKTRMQLFGK